MSASPVLLKARADGRVSALSNAVKMFPPGIVVLMERDEQSSQGIITRVAELSLGPLSSLCSQQVLLLSAPAKPGYPQKIVTELAGRGRWHKVTIFSNSAV